MIVIALWKEGKNIVMEQETKIYFFSHERRKSKLYIII